MVERSGVCVPNRPSGGCRGEERRKGENSSNPGPYVGIAEGSCSFLPVDTQGRSPEPLEMLTCAELLLLLQFRDS